MDQAPLSTTDGGASPGDPALDGSVLGGAAFADSVLAPVAEQVDIVGVIPHGHFEALAATGLFGLLGPTDCGGADATTRTARRTMAAIAGGCGATFFVWAQHHGVVRTLRSSTNEALRNTHLRALCDGDRIAGVAFAHVRRPGTPAVRARRIDGGWRLDGFAPWTTSWGIAHVFAIAAETDDGRIVWSMISADATDGIEARALALPILSSTGTVSLQLTDCRVDDSNVIEIMDADTWRAADRRTASVGSPAVFGVADRAIRLLDDAARSATDPAVATARSLRSELDACWAADDALLHRMFVRDPAPDAGRDSDLDRDSDEAGIAAASAHRARCLELGQRATTALLAATGGGGMDLRHPAQRLARETLFYVIQAQTNDGRSATLDQQRR